MAHRSRTVALALLGALGLVAVAAAESPSRDAGMVIYRDPATGEVVPPPPGVVPAPTAAPAAPSSPLIERPGTTRAGGSLVDLHGRFRNRVTVTKGADGRMQSRCGAGPE